MADITITSLEREMHSLKQDVAVIKHILSEEGKPSTFARRALASARATPDSKYVSHEKLKKRIRV